MSIEINSEILDKAARILDEADNRWQHGIGNSGESWERFVARAVLEAVAEPVANDAADAAYIMGFVDGKAKGERQALLDAADAIQALHPGEVKNSVIFLRDRAESVYDTENGDNT